MKTPAVLSVTGQLELESAASMRTVFFIGAGVRGSVVDRSGLVFDSRFAPESEGLEDVAVQLVLSGRVEVLGPAARTLDGPFAWIAREGAMEGRHAERAFAIRSTGAPFRALDLRVGPSAWTKRAPSDFETIPLAATTRGALEAIFAALDAPSGDVMVVLRALLDDLAQQGFVARGLGSSAFPFERLWPALAPFAEGFRALPTLQEVAALAGRSLRQVSRDVAELSRANGMGQGFRETTKRLRLKLAAVALSAEDVAIVDVAKSVGYGSVDAMARAFRDAGLPAPSEIRARVRGPVDPASFLP